MTIRPLGQCNHCGWWIYSQHHGEAHMALHHPEQWAIAKDFARVLKQAGLVDA